MPMRGGGDFRLRRSGRLCSWGVIKRWVVSLKIDGVQKEGSHGFDRKSDVVERTKIPVAICCCCGAGVETGKVDVED